MYNISMQIEIGELIPNKNNHDFWSRADNKGMKGGHINISLDNGNQYEFDLQYFVYYVVHRSYGKGFTKKIKRHEEGN